MSEPHERVVRPRKKFAEPRPGNGNSVFWRTKVTRSSLVLRLPPQHRKPHRVAPIQNALVLLMKSNGSGATPIDGTP
jgi:hypothetical protein